MQPINPVGPPQVVGGRENVLGYSVYSVSAKTVHWKRLRIPREPGNLRRYLKIPAQGRILNTLSEFLTEGEIHF